jgi:hypothetical protein
MREQKMVARGATGTDGAALPVRGTATAVQPAVIPVVRGRAGRTVGVLVDEGDGPRWQPTPDVEGLVRLGIVTAAAVALPVGVIWGLRRPAARVDRLSMGPGGWVSFKGFAVPKGRRERRPWWARLLRAHRVS